ncbi:hypothetical protein J6590_051107 [Homalodisca vitripennis]|nr:hypothetical protein J6590_051107 [Homalodisca vitripennis]
MGVSPPAGSVLASHSSEKTSLEKCSKFFLVDLDRMRPLHPTDTTPYPASFKEARHRDRGQDELDWLTSSYYRSSVTRIWVLLVEMRLARRGKLDEKDKAYRR